MDLESIYSYIIKSEESIFRMLEYIVNIDSYTHDKNGVNKVEDAICEYLNQLNISFQRIPNDNYGDHIIATVKGTKPGKILLMGHCDTPHQPGTVLNRPYKEDENYAYGPGVSDMKAGLVSMIYVATAIRNSSIDFCDIELLITPDEEYGSPISRSLIEERAKRALAVFNLEAGRPDGSIVTSRRGSAHFTFEIIGKSSHSGVAYEDGISAIEELGYKIVELKKLNELSSGITLNVGTVIGGENSNIVAPSTKGSIHVSYNSNKGFEELRTKMQNIFDTSFISGTNSTLHGGKGILPMERTKNVVRLYEVVKQGAESLEIDIKEKSEKGAADAGFVASLGIPVICAMGPVGGNWHRENEFMKKDTVIPRMKLLAYSIIASEQIFTNTYR